MPKNQSPRPQDFPTITVRGERLAKIGKRTASMAPVLGLAAAFAAFGGGSAIAQCVGGPSNFNCTGPITETTQQTFSGANISVELESSFSVDTTDNIGISINSTGGATLLQQGVPGQGANISGDQRGVRVDNTGGGAAIVTTTGAVSGDRALEVINRVGGSDLVINAHDINGFTTGIFMQNNGTGRTDATVTGNIVSVNTANNDSNFDGIFARGRADTTSMRIETFGTVIGGDEGIDAANFGSGDITVITHDTVTSLVEWGVLARSIGDGDVIVRVDGDVEAGGEGIRAINGQAASGGNPAVRPDGDISVTVNGNVNASTVTHGAGVFAQQYGDGTTDVTVLGDVTANSTFSSGVRFSGDGSGDAALVVEGDVDAGALGIDARQSGTGDISIDAIGDVSGFGFVGVYAEGTNGGTEIDINIFGVATSDVQHGAAIFNSGAGSTSLLHIQQGAVVTGGTSSVAVSHDNDEQFEIIIDGIVEAGTEGGLVNGRSFGTDFLSSGVDITIGENGRLGTAGSTAAAFTDNAADGTGLDAGSNLTVNGILAGGVNLGAGSDTVLINETATLEANVFFDGDAMEVGGVATTSDSGSDTVQINGGERSFFSDQFNAIELLQISGNAVVTFSDRNATTGLSNSTANLFSLQTDQGTTVLITDDYGVTGDLVNFGTVDLSTAAPTADTTLTIAPDGSGAGGDYISNGGQLRLDTVLNDGVTDQTDLLVVNGDTSGSTTVFVNNVGGAGGETGTGATDGIQIIEVSGASNGTFVLGHPVFAGAYTYGLNQADGQNWYLQSDFAGFASV